MKRRDYPKRNKVYGVGINDVDYCIIRKERVGNIWKITWKCPIYTIWNSMLGRCYSEKSLNRKETYKGCSVCDDWFYLSKFREWVLTQDWEGKQLDKDLLVEGNKVYSPETCIFVDKLVNSFVTNSGKTRGRYMIGCKVCNREGKMASACNNPFTGKQEWLGYFTDELEAHLTWKARKHELACQLADSKYVTDERLANALRTRYNEQSDWTNK